MNLLPQSTLDCLNLARFSPRRPTDGNRHGHHRSPFTGASAEFAQHREYCPGDEPRRIDWRVMARTDRFVVKQYDQETNLRATLVIDTSASMGFVGAQSHTPSKLLHASRIAAALAWVLIRQGDAVGLVACDRQIRRRLPCASTPGHLQHLLRTLTELQANSSSNLPAVIHQLAETLPTRGLVILLSDWLDDPSGLQHAFHHLRHRHHEVAVVQVLAQNELEFPFSESLRFRDLEGRSSDLDVDPPAIRRHYLRELAIQLKAVQTACHQVQADYLMTTTAEAVVDVLLSYLASRCGKRPFAGARP